MSRLGFTYCMSKKTLENWIEMEREKLENRIGLDMTTVVYWCVTFLCL